MTHGRAECETLLKRAVVIMKLKVLDTGIKVPQQSNDDWEFQIHVTRNDGSEFGAVHHLSSLDLNRCFHEVFGRYLNASTGPKGELNDMVSHWAEFEPKLTEAILKNLKTYPDLRL